IRESAALILALAGPEYEPSPRMRGRPDAAPIGSGDGLLYSSEIARLNLDADLITLSGCGTYGWTSYGGMIGPCDGFLRAGARSLLVSLWRVEDRATSLLMTRFYEILGAS